MIVHTIAFYMFSVVLLGSALGVVTLRNPVHSVLCLVLAFFNAGGLFVLLGAEFLAMILVIVYVGAVAVLFLFVVMMVRVEDGPPRILLRTHIWACLAMGGVLLAELVFTAALWQVLPSAAVSRAVPVMEGVDNTKALGEVLYTDYIYAFELSGLILLVAMVGAIVLTHRKRAGVKRQNIADQIARRPEDVMKIHKVQSRKGI